MISLRVNEIFNFLHASDEELLKKCHQCMEIIVSAKDRQAAEANKNASILLEQLDMERSREESKRAANARKREKRRKKKKEKQEKEQRQKDTIKSSSDAEDDNKAKEEQEGKTEEKFDDEDDDDDTDSGPSEPRIELPLATTTTTIGTTINADSRPPSNKRAKNDSNSTDSTTKTKNRKNRKGDRDRSLVDVKNMIPVSSVGTVTATPSGSVSTTTNPQPQSSNVQAVCNRKKKSEVPPNSGIGDLDVFGPPPSSAKSPREKERHRKSVERTSVKSNSIENFSAPLLSPGKATGSQGHKSPNITSPKRDKKKEEGWKEVIRKPSVGSRSKRVTVPSSAISRVIGRGGCNINAIREVSGAHIEVDKQKGSGDRVITMKGSTDATHQAHTLISALIKDPDKELEQILPRLKNRLSSSANNTLTSSNMWHNSMANGIGTTTISSQSTASPVVSHKSHGKTGGSSVRLSSTIGASLVSTPGAVVSNRSSLAGGTSRMGTNSTATGIPQGPIQVWKPPPVATNPSSPKRSHPSSSMGGMIAVCGPPPAKSQPNTVARQLFPGEKKPSTQVPSTSAKTTVTYSTVSTSKTKVVMSTSSTFAAKVDNISLMGPTKSLKTQSPNPNGNKLPSNVGFLGNKADLQPLPIKSGPGQGMSQGGKQNVGGSAPLPPGVPSGTPAEYSPFNNLFSQVAEQVLGKKEDLQGDGRKNFASVAAAGVIPSNSQGPCSSPVTVPAPEEHDPNLQAKAPGYKGPTHRTSSPQLCEQDLSRAPGYRVRHPINFDQMDPQQMLAFMTSMGMVAGQPFLEGDPNRAPGYKGHISVASPVGGHGPPDTSDPARAPGYKPSNSQHSSQSNLSPRSTSSTPSLGGLSPNAVDPQHPLPPHQQLLLGPLQNLHIRDEYSTPNQPMTLPKIESTLNPNAPNFTSRSLVPPHPGQQLPPGQINPSLGFSGNQPLGPNIGPQPGFRAPPPPGVIGQPPPFNSLAQANPNFLSQAAAMLPSDLNTLANLMNHPAIMGAQGTIPAAMPRQFNPQALLSRPASTPAMGASKEDSPLAPVGSEASPASSSAPSPTDQMKPGTEDRRLLRPIGTERAQKKPPTGPGYPGAMGDGAATGLWAFSADLGSDWMSTVSTVMTTSVTSSTILTPGLAADGEERPPSHPTVTPHLVPGAFTLDPGAMDQPTDHAFQAQALLLSSSGGTPLFPNGVPAAAAAALPAVATVYPQPGMGGDAGPSMWNQQVKMPQTDPSTDSKMWNNWTPPPSM